MNAKQFGLKTLCSGLNNTHILVKADNAATVGGINNMGSSKSIPMDAQIKKVWKWTLSKGNWITAAHIPGIYNVEADLESRRSETSAEWRLNPNDYSIGIRFFNRKPTIDLFASRLNTQIKKFISYRPDPQAIAVIAFTIDWENLDFYAFQPFNCIGRTLQKIWMDKATGILVVPDWPNQIWYNKLLDMTINHIIFPPRSDLLMLPMEEKLCHPLAKSLQIRMALVSGIDLQIKT